MNSVEIVAIGTELIIGKIVNTNSTYLARRLFESGIESYYQSVVGDNEERISRILREALSRNQAVIVTGGLGPTVDDITREVVAELAQKRLIYCDEAAELVKRIFESRNREMPQSNYKQFYYPEGAIPFLPKVGTALGFSLRFGDKTLYCLPGVPNEMQEMFESYVLPDLLGHFKPRSSFFEKEIITFGITESRIADLLKSRELEHGEMARAGNPAVLYAYQANKVHGVKIRLITQNADDVEAERILNHEIAIIHDLIGSDIVSISGESLNQVVKSLLEKARKTIATAESITGGLIGDSLVQLPGASNVFKGSICAYSSEIKRQLLHIKSKEIISADCALELAGQVKQLFGSDYALSSTGVAGPESEENKPVGLVFVGIATPDKIYTKEYFLTGSRNEIRATAANCAIDLLRRELA